MARTYAQMLTLISQILQDSGNVTFSTTELDALIPEALTLVSRYRPRETKETLVTIASKNLTLSTENKRKLLWIDGKEGAEEVEYKVDLNPPSYHHFTRYGDIVTMAIDAIPSAGLSVYLYMAKKHILQKEVGTSDLLGAIKTLAAVGATSLALKALGTGTINEDTVLKIAGDSTDYTVTAQATIATNEATVSITPALVTQAAVDAVVTLSLSTSTLDLDLEECLADYVVGIADMSKSHKHIPIVNVAGGSVWANYLTVGRERREATLRRLQSLARPKAARTLSRS